ncbi:MAG: ABC transporter permease [Candidatus Cyclobacteriaceae bacterium M3_2C_046]
MIKNYFIVALRSLKRNKFYTIINILGLTMGISIAFFIFLLVRYESSFEAMHQDKDNIYRVVYSRENKSGVNYNAQTPYPAVEAIRLEYPELDIVTGIHYDEDVLVHIDGQKFQEDWVIFADSNFFEMFDFGHGTNLVIAGDLSRSLAEPGFAVLSESLTKKYFQDKDPLGQRIKLRNQLELEVGAVIKDTPVNTHLRYNLMASLPSLNREYTDYPLDNWNFVTSGYTYLRLPSGLSPDIYNQRFRQLVQKNYHEDVWDDITFSLQPLSDIHFNSTFQGGLSTHIINKNYIPVLIVIGIFIILIACINFINLSTAMGLRKSREVGVRKVLGALKFNLIKQFTGEAFILTFFSGFLAMLITLQIIPAINQYLQREILFQPWQDIYLWLFLIGLLVLVSLLSGLYPSMVLSSYQPVQALKGKLNHPDKKSLWLRRGLVIFQFFIAQLLIIATIIIFQQIHFIKNKSMGFNKEAIINVPLPLNDSLKTSLFKSKLESENTIQALSLGLGAPYSDNLMVTPFRQVNAPEDENYLVFIKSADPDYLKVYGLNLLSGRWLAQGDFQPEPNHLKFVVNKELLKQLNITDAEQALGTILTTGMGGRSGEIVGVVDDVHVTSLHESVKPVLFTYFPDIFVEASIKLSPGNYTDGITAIQKVFHDIYPDYIFQYDFLDETIKNLYEEEERTFGLMQVFSLIAILIGCLGLIGLIMFMVKHKQKEIGLRKMLGASVNNIILLLFREYAFLIIISLAFSIPLAWHFSGIWLENFAYRIKVNPVIFISGGIISIVIAFISVMWHSLKAARMNPVDILENE